MVSIITRSVSKRLKNNNTEVTLFTQPELTLKSISKCCEGYIANKKKNFQRLNNINERTIRRLSKIIDELKELESFIGLGDVKKSILEHVLYMTQKLNSDTDMNHIQIVGETRGQKKQHSL